ncbi:GtrA family protein [Pseudomonas sp. NFIX28]|uniref:GtrA family protein n=1 Tax=Pseudomonas sp. NFIX28 TaxID=1566235 RepID=UPI00111373A1|nr:GtrA family protein [Pseudomonas sp. NFIX28]
MKTSSPHLPSMFASLVCYLGVGSLATAAHQALFLLFVALDQALLGSILGALLGALLSFALGSRTCFASRGGKTLQPLRFACVAGLHNILNAVAMVLLLRHETHPLLAQALTTGCLTLLVFFLHRQWTYHHADLVPSRTGR